MSGELDDDVKALLVAVGDIIASVPAKRVRRMRKDAAEGLGGTTTVWAPHLLKLIDAAQAWNIEGEPLGDYFIRRGDDARAAASAREAERGTIGEARKES